MIALNFEQENCTGGNGDEGKIFRTKPTCDSRTGDDTRHSAPSVYVEEDGGPGWELRTDPDGRKVGLRSLFRQIGEYSEPNCYPEVAVRCEILGLARGLPGC